jgi:hypothetical protein
LVTPPGLTRQGTQGVLSGQTPNMTRQNFFAQMAPQMTGQGNSPVAASIARPVMQGPFAQPGSAQAFVKNWNADNAGVMHDAGTAIDDDVLGGLRPDPGQKHGSRAVAVYRPDGSVGARLIGTQGFTSRYTKAQQDAAAQRPGFQLSKERLAIAQGRAADRRNRIAARRRGPTPLDVLFARNPAAAMQFALAQQQMGLQGRLGAMQYGGLPEARQAEAALNLAKAGNPLQFQMGDILGAGFAGGRSIQDMRQVAGMFGGGGGAVQPSGRLVDLPPEIKAQADQQSDRDARTMLQQQGLGNREISQYLRQRAVDNRPSIAASQADAALGSVGDAMLAIPGVEATLGAVGPWLPMVGLGDQPLPPPVGLNPSVVARLTPEQKKRLGIGRQQGPIRGGGMTRPRSGVFFGQQY